MDGGPIAQTTGAPQYEGRPFMGPSLGPLSAGVTATGQGPIVPQLGAQGTTGQTIDPTTGLPTTTRTAPAAAIRRRIRNIRGQNVMLDRGPAELQGVRAIAFGRQVKQNRVPPDFPFRLPKEEAVLRSSQTAKKLNRSLPYALTQERAAMLSSVLSGTAGEHRHYASPRARALRCES